jgi:hypothetical protein
MPVDRNTKAARSEVRVLSAREIDHRIRVLVEEFAWGQARVREAESRGNEPAAPRWIEPAELVRHMHRFLVYN